MPGSRQSWLRKPAARLRRRARALRKRNSRDEFFDLLAPVYDDWWRDDGRFTPGSRPGWSEEVTQVLGVLHALEPLRTLDVGCGTGFLTGELPGAAAGLDGSEQMLEIARTRVPDVEFVQGDATSLPFADRSFGRVFASVLCTHLEPAVRAQFLAEARRISEEVVILETSVNVLADDPGGLPPVDQGQVERIQTRVAPDGSRHSVYKRWLTAERLSSDLGGGEILHEGHYFVIVRSPSAQVEGTPA
jgi:ubiquinone/menaquinone biosynthesis C-methylase UbiE